MNLNNEELVNLKIEDEDTSILMRPCLLHQIVLVIVLKNYKSKQFKSGTVIF
jgi:hypothetical protein